jgi:hypothetical protein
LGHHSVTCWEVLGFETWNRHLELGQMGAWWTGTPSALLFPFFSLVPSLALLRSRSRLRFRPQRLFIFLFAGARSSKSSNSYGVAVLDSPGECDFSAFSHSTLWDLKVFTLCSWVCGSSECVIVACCRIVGFAGLVILLFDLPFLFQVGFLGFRHLWFQLWNIWSRSSGISTNDFVNFKGKSYH